jgi:hypothetical protein
MTGGDQLQRQQRTEQDQPHGPGRVGSQRLGQARQRTRDENHTDQLKATHDENAGHQMRPRHGHDHAHEPEEERTVGSGHVAPER